MVVGAVPVRIRDIAETGQIEVLLGPYDQEVATRARGMDFFALPQFADVPRRALGPGAVSVVFD
jgi:hypothetical protein